MPTNPPQPECPRCGYDQTGVASSWKGACPLEGVCAECGLRFEWRLLLNAELVVERVNFESARRPTAKGFVTTLARLPRPRKLWTTLRMTDPLRPDRVLLVLTVAIAALVVATYLGTLAFNLGMALNKYNAWRAIGVFRYAPSNAVYAARSTTEAAWRHEAAWVALLWLSAVPVAFALAPTTVRRARVRARHLARVWLYSLWVLPVPVLLRGVPDEIQYGVPRIASFFTKYNPWEMIDVYPFWKAWANFWGIAKMYAVPLALLLTLPLVLRHWSCACRDYLRLRQPRLAALALVLIALLLALAVSWYTGGLLPGYLRFP